MIISFTGTQNGMTSFQKETLSEILSDKQCSQLVNGACIGADEEATLIAMKIGVKQFEFYPSTIYTKHSKIIMAYYTEPYKWLNAGQGISIKFHERQPPLIRNQKIVDSSSLLIACPKEFKMSIRSGTWSTIRYAWKRKVVVTIIPPVNRES